MRRMADLHQKAHGRVGRAPVSPLPAPRGDSAGEPERRRRSSRRRLIELTFLLPVVAYLVPFFGYPLVKNLIMGFQYYTTKTFFTGSAPWAGWANYRAIFHAPGFHRTVFDTIVFTVASIAGQFTIGLAIACFFNRRFPLSGILRSLLLLPWLIPLIVTSAVWRWILDQDSGALNRALSAVHITNGHFGWLTGTSAALVAVIIVNIWIGIPFNATLLYGGLQNVPDELYEAAELDGADGWRGFRYITWPLIRPVVNVTLVLGVVYTLKVLDLILGLTNGGPADSTQTLATESYHLSFVSFDFGAGAAMSNVLIVVSLVFALVYLRATRHGMEG
jgi:multiple sugar transport system permease protein